MAQPLREGMTGTAPDGTRVTVRGGKIVPLPPEGTVAAPQYGSRAYQTTDGAILTPTKGGSVQTLRGAQTAGAEARTRLQLGLGPTIEAQQNLYEAEQWNPQAQGVAKRGSNPLDTLRGGLAEIINPEEPGTGVRTRLAKQVGGQRYQDYDQAARSFESAFMPILSGAAVTPSEAKRLIAAALPQPGDTPATLAQKAKQRAMMINAAAELLGKPPPFPRIGSAQFGPSVEVSIPSRPEAGTGRAYGRSGGATPAKMSDAEIKAALGL